MHPASNAQEGLRCDAADVRGDLNPGLTGTDDQHALTGEPVRRAVLARVHHRNGRVPRKGRPRRVPMVAVRDDDRAVALLFSAPDAHPPTGVAGALDPFDRGPETNVPAKAEAVRIRV